MTKRSMEKRLTHEDKFDRKWWVNNKAKRSYVRFLKKSNRRKARRFFNKESKDDEILHQSDERN